MDLPPASLRIGQQNPAAWRRRPRPVLWVPNLREIPAPALRAAGREPAGRVGLALTDTNLPPGELAKFTDHVSWVVKQYGIKDPAAFLAYQVQLEAKAAGKLGSSVKIGAIPVQSKSAGRGAVTFENSTATASAASPRERLAVLTTAWGATKAEVLSRAKAGIEQLNLLASLVGGRHSDERRGLARKPTVWERLWPGAALKSTARAKA